MLRSYGLILLFGLIVRTAGAGPLLISEVLYDAQGSDQGRAFVELIGPGDMSLAGYSLEGVNGVGGAITNSIPLDGVTIPSDGFLVLADLDASGRSTVLNADFGFPKLDFQNGPDSIRLMFRALVVDALGYGDFGGSLVFAGEGLPVPDAPAGSSLARRVSWLDTDHNAADFLVDASPTPGFEDPPAVAVPTPEPSSLLLMACGLLVLHRVRSRYRSKQKRTPFEEQM